MTSENGEAFIKNLAQFVRTHEKALANALQLRKQRSRVISSDLQNGEASPTLPQTLPSLSTAPTTSSFASTFSLSSFSFASHNIKPAKLTLTPHHLFYLLSRFEELGVEIGAMNVRIENIHTSQSPANYVSFLSQPQKSRGRSDKDSVHSISSIRSVMSTMSTFWSSLGIGSGAAKTEKAQMQLRADTKYLYSAFTKIPCLRLSPDHHARLISGYEEFPFDTAVPLWAFKNLSALEIYDVDFRQFYGWDRLSEQLRSLTIKRGSLEDPLDLIVNIVLDDIDKRRRRSSKPQSPPTPSWPGSANSPTTKYGEQRTMSFSAGTADITHQHSSNASPRASMHHRGQSEIIIAKASHNKNDSPTRPRSSRHNSSYRHVKLGNERTRRSGSASSNSSSQSLSGTSGRRSSSNLVAMGILPASKWRFLRHLSLADNSLTMLTPVGLAPLANTLQSLDLSSNLFTEVPECLSTLTALRALNLANCMIESLHSLAKNPLPAIAVLNLRSNRLQSLAGIERLFSLERVDLRENNITDPMELARLTGIPEIRDIFVVKNPFTKLHPNYRVTIFNLFRTTPGHTEDICIDATGPGYTERRHLKDRVAESAAVPVMKPVVTTTVEENLESNTDHARIPSSISSRVVIVDRPVPHSVQSEAVISSTRRRKSTKRRIVDLSADGEVFISRPKRAPSVIVQQQPIRLVPDVDGPSPMTNGSPEFVTVQPSMAMLKEDPFVSKAVIPVDVAMTPPRTPQQSAVSHEELNSFTNEMNHLKLNSDSTKHLQDMEAATTTDVPRWLPISNETRWSSEYSAGRDIPRTHSDTLHGTNQNMVVSPGRTLGQVAGQ